MDDEMVSAESGRFLSKVYAWMVFALIVSGVIARWAASNPPVVELLLENKIFFWGMILSEFAIVLALTVATQKISSQWAGFLFVLYSVINGFTLSVIFLVFTPESIASVFFITAGTFAVMSLYGFLTKNDLTSLGNLCLMALVGLVITGLVNMYYQNEEVSFIGSIAGVLIFVGLIAHDTQKIKKLNIIGNEGTETDRKESIVGALTLYLDFVNLFLSLLNLFGKKKS